MMPVPVEWLLQGDPWTVYHTLVNIMDLPLHDDRVQAAHRSVLQHPLTQAILQDLYAWPNEVINSHKKADHAIHKLSLLADFGLNKDDAVLQPVIERILDKQSPQGPFWVKMNIPAHFGGSGEDQLAWALCDAPLIMASLIRFGLGDHPAVQRSFQFLVPLCRENGWPCLVSKELGRFRGPGRKDDPCPYATLLMLKALAFLPDEWEHPAAQNGIETLLNLWQNSRESHPYMFFMGTDFRKLKAPLVWFDILHVLEVLSYFPRARQDQRLLEMLSVLTASADSVGRYTPESTWMAWKNWDFGQKKQPSGWLTALAASIQKRF